MNLERKGMLGRSNLVIRSFFINQTGVGYNSKRLNVRLEVCYNQFNGI